MPKLSRAQGARNRQEPPGDSVVKSSARLLVGGLAAGLLLAACNGAETSEPSPDDPEDEDAAELTEEPPDEAQDGEGEEDVESDASVELVISNYPVLHYGTPWLMGQELGIFEEEGVSIEDITGGAGGGATLRNVLAGGIPFALVSPTAVVEGYIAGAPIIAIGGGIQTVAEFEYVTAPGLGVSSLEELGALDQDITCGFSNPGSITEALCYTLADELGMSIPGEIEPMAAGGVGEGIPLLIDGTIDVFPMPDPVATEQSEDLGPSLGPPDDFVPLFQQLLVITNQEFLDNEPETLEALMRGFARSTDEVYDDVERAAELYAETAEIDPEAARITIESVVEAGEYSMGLESEALEVFDDIMARTQEIEDIPWNEIFDTRIMESLDLDYPDYLDDPVE